jgi:hypothetical protein
MKNGFKAGKKVRAHSPAKNGISYTGRIVGIEERVNGAWYSVNVAAPRKPMHLKCFRASQLTLAR